MQKNWHLTVWGIRPSRNLHNNDKLAQGYSISVINQRKKTEPTMRLIRMIIGDLKAKSIGTIWFSGSMGCSDRSSSNIQQIRQCMRGLSKQCSRRQNLLQFLRHREKRPADPSYVKTLGVKECDVSSLIKVSFNTKGSAGISLWAYEEVLSKSLEA